MPEKKIELSSIASRWEMDEDEELFRIVTKEESGKTEEEEEDVKLPEWTTTFITPTKSGGEVI